MPGLEVHCSTLLFRELSNLLPVIGERIVTPQALVHLVLKLRISPPKSTTSSEANGNIETESRPTIDTGEEARIDDAFLNNPRDAEDLTSPTPILGSAHVPLWPLVCRFPLPRFSLLTRPHAQDHKPSWWIVIADVKSDRLVVPPLKVTDVPFADSSRVRDYRSYKLKFQAPAGTGLFTWRVMVVSDTFIGEDGAKDLQVCYSYNILTVAITDARLVTRGRIYGAECRRAT